VNDEPVNREDGELDEDSMVSGGFGGMDNFDLSFTREELDEALEEADRKHKRRPSDEL